jgi:RIO-like serine/threonine protein kinase
MSTFIDNKCNQNCWTTFDRFGNLQRSFPFESDCVREWEIYVYLKLVHTHIVPLCDADDKKIVYNVAGYISLRECLLNTRRLSLLLNELFSFVNGFRVHGFIHGNLHIDNIMCEYVGNEPLGFRFVVVDYANAYLTNSRRKPAYRRQSFMGHFDANNELDFTTLSVSLRAFMQKYMENKDALSKLNKLISQHVTSAPQSSFLHF